MKIRNEEKRTRDHSGLLDLKRTPTAESPISKVTDFSFFDLSQTIITNKETEAMDTENGNRVEGPDASTGAISQSSKNGTLNVHIDTTRPPPNILQKENEPNAYHIQELVAKATQKHMNHLEKDLAKTITVYVRETVEETLKSLKLTQSSSAGVQNPLGSGVAGGFQAEVMRINMFLAADVRPGNVIQMKQNSTLRNNYVTGTNRPLRAQQQ